MKYYPRVVIINELLQKPLKYRQMHIWPCWIYEQYDALDALNGNEGAESGSITQFLSAVPEEYVAWTTYCFFD